MKKCEISIDFRFVGSVEYINLHFVDSDGDYRHHKFEIKEFHVLYVLLNNIRCAGLELADMHFDILQTSLYARSLAKEFARHHDKYDGVNISFGSGVRTILAQAWNSFSTSTEGKEFLKNLTNSLTSKPKEPIMAPKPERNTYFAYIIPSSVCSRTANPWGIIKPMIGLEGKIVEFERVNSRESTSQPLHPYTKDTWRWLTDNLVKVDITREQFNKIHNIKPPVVPSLPMEVQAVLDASKYKGDKDIQSLLLSIDSVYMKKKRSHKKKV